MTTNTISSTTDQSIQFSENVPASFQYERTDTKNNPAMVIFYTKNEQDPATQDGKPVLDEPDDSDESFNASALSIKLNGSNHDADSFQIMSLIHQIFIQMRRQAAESKQDAYRNEWTALENKAVKIEQAAAKELGAAIATGAISIVGGVAGMRASSKAITTSYKAAKINVPNTPAGQSPSPTSNIIKSEIKTPLNSKPAVQSEASAPTVTNKPATSAQNTPAQNANAAQKTNNPTTPPKPANKGNVDGDNGTPPASKKADDAPTTQPNEKAEANSKTDGPDKATDTADKPMSPADKKAHLNNLSRTYSSDGQIYTGLAQGVSSLAGAPLTYAAKMDTAEQERQQAEATKAQADVESEAEFVRSATEGEKAIRDFLQQVINSRAQVHAKIFA